MSAASDITVATSAFVVAVVAVFGVWTWRRELIGKTKFELARKTMLLGSKLISDFESARNPFTWAGESVGRTKEDNESASRTQTLDQWYARAHRLQPLVEDLRQFEELHWEAEAILSAPAAKCVSEALAVYRKQFAELSSAISSYFDTVARGCPLSDEDQKWLRELSKDMYSRGDDDFSQLIREATTNLAQALKPYVR